MPNSLRTRFMIIFISLALLPQILILIILGSQAFSSQEEISMALHQEIAKDMAHRIDEFLQERENELLLMDKVVGLGVMDKERQRIVLSNMLLNHRNYQELILLNAVGQEQIYLSRLEVVLDSELESRGDGEEFLFPMREQDTYFGPVQYDSAIREPLIKIAVPILDRRSGEVRFVLIGKFRFKAIWDLIADLDFPPQHEVFVIDQGGRVVAHRNPTVTLMGSLFDMPEKDGRGTGLSGQTSIIGSYVLSLGQQRLTIVSQETLSSALAEAISGLRFMVVMIILSLFPAIALAILITRQIVHPIESLATTARAISAGDLNSETQFKGSDEIGDLTLAFNIMTRQLGELIGTLEKKVAERTHDLEEVLTKQKDLIDELEAKNAELERFMYTVSHDLKSPLITIKGFLGYIEQNIQTGNQKQVEEDLVRVSQAASKMQEMLDDLLEVSRVGRVVNSPEVILMDVLVKEAVESVAGRLIERNIIVDIAPDLPQVFGDRTRLRELMENLIDNAAKFMGNQTEPRIEIGSQDGVVGIGFYVRDNGIGIEPHHLDRVFNIFEQLDQSAEGSGIGLAIVRRIVETHGGKIWAESEGLGKGSTFYFYLAEKREILK